MPASFTIFVLFSDIFAFFILLSGGRNCSCTFVFRGHERLWKLNVLMVKENIMRINTGFFTPENLANAMDANPSHPVRTAPRSKDKCTQDKNILQIYYKHFITRSQKLCRYQGCGHINGMGSLRVILSCKSTYTLYYFNSKNF